MKRLIGYTTSTAVTLYPVSFVVALLAGLLAAGSRHCAGSFFGRDPWSLASSKHIGI